MANKRTLSQYDGTAGPTGATGSAGTSFTWQGAWVSGHSYALNDVVSNGGGSYICILASSGTTAPPSDATHWSVMAAQGAAGSAGALDLNQKVLTASFVITAGYSSYVSRRLEIGSAAELEIGLGSTLEIG